MKRLLLGVLAACCSTLAYSQATEIVVETYAENIGMTGTTDLTGYNTYRVYVKFASDQDFLTAVYGDVDFPTKIQGGNNFFNSTLGTLNNESYNPVLFGSFPDLEYDSFITIGMDGPAVTATARPRSMPWETLLPTGSHNSNQAVVRQVPTSSLTPRLVEVGSHCIRTATHTLERTAW